MSVAGDRARAAERCAALGKLGTALRRVVDGVPAGFAKWGLARQYAYVYTFLPRKLYIEAAAVSLLYCDATVQVPYNHGLCMWLVRNAIRDIIKPAYAKDVRGWVDGQLPPVDWVAFKRHPAAVSKSNVYFREMMRSAVSRCPDAYAQAIIWREYLYEMTNDQACGVLLYATGLARHYGWDFAMRLGICAVIDNSNVKCLSGVIKALGQTAELTGAVLAEANCIVGRGVAPINEYEAALERVVGHGTPACQLFDDESLRSAIRSIIADEIDMNKVEIRDVDAFWESRWAWCVNGAHSRMVEKHDARWAVPMGGQVHRRVAIESWTNNPIKCWDGTVYVSPSSKLEHGKTRLLLACDTVSYINFEHLMQSVEPAWKGKRVILDPGKGGAAGIARRVRNMGQGACYAALDYDDFNSQHTLAAQKILIEETCNMIGYDRLLTDRLVSSFDRMLICYGGKELGYAHSTLMSGHRCTTYINSVLNAAYIKCALGDTFNRLKSMHVGDDIIAACAGSQEAEMLLQAMQRTKCRMNPLKQSIGVVTGEFLRMSINKRYACGYLARSVASAVSGNWTADKALSPPERLRTVIVQARSLINRSGVCENVALLLAHAASKRTGIKVDLMSRLLTGRITLGPGPVYAGSNTVIEYAYEDTSRERMRMPDGDYSLNATTSYLTSALSDVEREALIKANVSVKNAMAEASYMKSLATRADPIAETRRYRFRLARAYRLPGSTSDRDALSHDRWPGVLGKYPILQLIRQRMPASLVRDLVLKLAPRLRSLPLEVAAWGYESCGYRLIGILPYADAAAISSRMAYGVVYVENNVYM